MRTLILVFALLPALALAQDAPAPDAPPAKPKARDQVYKWVDKDGVVHYSSQPPAEGAKPAKLPPLQTYKGGTSPNLSKFQQPTSKAGAAPGGPINIEIVTPTHDETFRGGERVVPVAVMVTPQIGAGQKLIYLLDGAPASAPTTDTSFALTNVDRGSHSVSVTLVGEGGDEIAASGSVTFHMKPTTVEQAKKTRDTQHPPPKPAPKPKPPAP